MPKKEIKKTSIKKSLVEQLGETWDVPKETLLNIPIITLEGNSEIRVENFDGIAEYGEMRMRLNTQCGVLVIEGNGLYAKSMNTEMIKIQGDIHLMRYE